MLLSDHADRLTVIASSDEMRKTGQQVGYALSWEQLTEEILTAVRMSLFSMAKRVIVICGADGAVIVELDSPGTLVFDSQAQEGDWGKRHQGVGAAYGRCIDAAVVLGLSENGEAAVTDFVKRGLADARAAHVAGFLVNLDAEPDVVAEPFPLENVARAILEDGDEFASVAYRPAESTLILFQTYGEQALVKAAELTAVHGLASLPNGIPVETVGAWVSVDRAEIESLRGMRNIMQEYVQQRLRGSPVDRPIWVAIFDPPGGRKDLRRAPDGERAAWPTAHA